ncbi:glutathione S-transferase family protein [Parvibaculum sp.]|uniref:glutathione S-transferase family protein n=1 Tax=Parvibaculum sp. TaxID=2024848 RepID=UPI00320F5DFA
MQDFELVIGDKNWSTWSLRPWILMKVAGIPFREAHIRLRQEDTKAQALSHSPSGLVPVLKWDGNIVSDSLAICETLADLFPEKTLWPTDLLERAQARSAACEMHSGFTDLRRDMPMDIINRHPGEGHSEGALGHARRIADIWRTLRSRYGRQAKVDDGFLFGHFTIADAMYVPVATRFRTYGVDLAKLGDDGLAKTYMDRLLALPAFLEWEEGARREMAARA